MQDNQIIYDLVKETRDDIKLINEKLNTHILNTNTQLGEAKAPVTFLKGVSTVALWVGAVGGMISPIIMFFSHPKP